MVVCRCVCVCGGGWVCFHLYVCLFGIGLYRRGYVVHLPPHIPPTHIFLPPTLTTPTPTPTEEVLQGHSAYKAAMQQQLTTLEQQQQDLHEQVCEEGEYGCWIYMWEYTCGCNDWGRCVGHAYE